MVKVRSAALTLEGAYPSADGLGIAGIAGSHASVPSQRIWGGAWNLLTGLFSCGVGGAGRDHPWATSVFHAH